MVTIDPEIVKEVTVKQFDHFVDAIHIEAPPDELVLDLAQGKFLFEIFFRESTGYPKWIEHILKG